MVRGTSDARVDGTMSNKRSSVLLIFKSVLFLLALFVFTGIIHEVAHLVAAKAMGVTIASFTWFDSQYLAPSFVTAGTESELAWTVVGCAGGFIAGTVLLGTVAVKMRWFRASFFRWLAGLWTFTWGASQVSVCFLEGFANDTYLANSLDLFSWASVVMLAGGLLGVAVYIVWSPEGLRRDVLSSSRDLSPASTNDSCSSSSLS